MSPAVVAASTKQSRKHSKLLLLGYRGPIEELQSGRREWVRQSGAGNNHNTKVDGLTLCGNVDTWQGFCQKTLSTGRERYTETERASMNLKVLKVTYYSTRCECD